MGGIEKFGSDLANELGVPLKELPTHVIEKAAVDPLFLHHLVNCKSDSFMLQLLFRESSMSAVELSKNHINNSQLFKSAVSAAIKWLSTGARFTAEDEYEARIHICFSCPNMSKPPTSPLYSLLNTRYICGLCGCDIERKAKLDTEACPDTEYSESGRWPRKQSFEMS
jgi:hypothetical protein